MWRTDRSRYELGLECKRARYYQYHFNGTGIVPHAASVPQVSGHSVHAGLAALVTSGDIEAAVAAALDAYQREVSERGFASIEDAMLAYKLAEQRGLCEALVRGWHRVRYPVWTEEYELVMLPQTAYVEIEDTVALAPGIELMVRADCVARRRFDGAIHIFNWKTDAYWATRRDLQDYWDHSVARLSEMLSVEARLGEPVEAVVMELLYKGREYKGENTSPLVRGFANSDTGEVSYEYQRGAKWRAVKAWEQPGGVKSWIDKMPLEVLQAQFTQTMPLMRDSGRIESLKRQWISEEQHWLRLGAVLSYAHHQSDNELDRLAPQNFHHCHRFADYPCPYVRCCFGNGPEEHIANGFYVPRSAHHPQEFEV
jgi:hypothetical protein